MREQTLYSMLKHALKFARLKILSTCYIVVFLGSASAGSITSKSFLAIFVLISWYIHAASSNDYADRKIDAINLHGAKDRPLITKTLTYGKLWAIHFVAGTLALLLSVLYGIPAVLLTLVILGFSYAYSFEPVRLTGRGALSQLLLPLAYVCYPFSLGFWAADPAKPYPWLLMAGLYIGFVARLFLKDFRDIEGDRKFNKRTFLVRHGQIKTCIASGLSALISLMILSFEIGFSIGTLAVLIVGNVAAIRLLGKLAKTEEIKHQVELVAVMAKIANASVISLLAFYICKYYFGSGSQITVVLPALIGALLMIILWKRSRHGVTT